MAEVLDKLFSAKARVLVKDGTFNNVEGRFIHVDHSQRMTNEGCFNVSGSTFHNVHNSTRQDIHYGQGARSMHHTSHSTALTGQVDGSAMNNHAPIDSAELVHTPVRSNRPPLLHGSPSMSAQFPGQHAYVQCGDIRSMSAGVKAFMDHQMRQMLQEMESEFGADNGDQDASNMTVERVYQPKDVTVIQGNHREVDNSAYEFNFNSHRVANNAVEDSFNMGL
ncbi:hypothetical protein BYT27DRAFT_7215120 [Phlegmacium glaucopus]|nr:hypothetical protein BYT27DRAFT_7215120 [Phlegmacium glaucopus]